MSVIFRTMSKRAVLAGVAAMVACLIPATATAGTLRTDPSGVVSGAPANSTAIGTTLHGSSTLDAIAGDIVGSTDMVVSIEDDPAEWQAMIGEGSETILGVMWLADPGSVRYHAIFLGPTLSSVLDEWLGTGAPPVDAVDEFRFAVAAMALIHESFHWRLLSLDESAVNACTLEYFPYYLAKDFGVPATVSVTATKEVPVTTTARVLVRHVKVTKTRVQVKGKWVTRTRRQTVTTYRSATTTTNVSQPLTTTLPNKDYATLVAYSQDFYAQQPPPYHGGICPI